MKMRLPYMTLMFVLLNFSAYAAITTSCDCSAKDPIAKSKCGPEPKKLNSNIFLPPLTCGIPTIAKVMQESVRSCMNSDVPKNTKTNDELLDYISCYRPNDETFCHFKTTLAPHIALAAESAGLPFAVQACLFYRESGYEPDVRSTIPREGQDSLHAKGYIQFLEGYTITTVDKNTKVEKTTKVTSTVSDMNTIIQGSISDWKQEISDFEKSDQAEIEKLNHVKQAVADAEEVVAQDAKNLHEATKSIKKDLIKAANMALAEDRKVLKEAKRIEKIRVGPMQAAINYIETRRDIRKAYIAAKEAWDKYWEGTASPPTKV